MNSYFSAGDWAVIVLYLLGIIGLGVWFGKDQYNTRDYFLGSKSVPWWGIGLSIVAAETSALTIIGVPAMAYGGNIAFLQMIIGYVIARIILAIVLVPHYFIFFFNDTATTEIYTLSLHDAHAPRRVETCGESSRVSRR